MATVDGHAPGLRGNQLDAYLAAGVESDHECFALDEALKSDRRNVGFCGMDRFAKS